jgi:hypothetical protein
MIVELCLIKAVCPKKTVSASKKQKTDCILFTAIIQVLKRVKTLPIALTTGRAF